MPVLPAQQAHSAQEASANSGSFEAYDPGIYTARLAKVTAAPAKSSGNPMWTLEFEKIQDLTGKTMPGRLWTNLVLIESVMWKVGQFFSAYGVGANTNTDALVGFRCRLDVNTRIVEQGKRKGQLGNEIGGFLPLQEGDEGYLQAKQLAAKLGGGQPAVKATSAARPAAAKATPASAPAEAADPAAEAPPAAAAATPAAGDPWAGEPDPEGVDF